MKAIIYYSLSGRTKRELEARYEGDFYRIKGKIKIPKGYWKQMMYLGFLSSFSVPLNYKDLKIDFDQYDEIVLGSPVWAFTIVPFMKRYLREQSFKNKKVHLLITHEGGPKNAMKHFKKFLHSSNTIVEEQSLKLGSSYQEYKKRKQKKSS
jgi:flavodoxin